MSASLTFYTNPMSRGRIVRWMLEEVGEPYDTHFLGFGPPMKGDYRGINPMGKVPTVVHDDKVVTECAAICAYLADVYPQAGLAPEAGDRADYYRWMFFAAGPLEAAVTNRSLKVEVPAEQQGMVGYGSFEDVMDTLERAVSGKRFIAGDRFTAADVYVGSHVAWGLQFGSIDKRQAFANYFAGLKERPAYKRANELDDAAMAQQKQG